MLLQSRYEFPSAKVIRALLQHTHELSIHSDGMPSPLIAAVSELDLLTGRLVLEAEYAGQHIERYLGQGCVNLDIEAVKGQYLLEREAYSLSNVAAKLLKTDRAHYRFECQLPESVFIHDHRGAMRIPFILGMQARVNLEVYPHQLSIDGRVRNLSVGGCLVDTRLTDCLALSVDQEIPGVTLEFPNGESFFAEGCVRHIRPFGHHGHAAIGIQFVRLSAAQSEALFRYVTEAEHEAGYHTGANDKMDYHSTLFIAGAKEKKIQQREALERDKRSRQTPMEKGVLDVSHHMQVGLMYTKTHDAFPGEVLYDCVDTLRYLIELDRKALMFALACLRDEPEWVRHAVQAACQLADMLLTRDPYDPQIREAMLGTLIHDMGKPLLVGPQLPSLKVHMNPVQKEILRGHVSALRQRLMELDWSPSPVCQEIIDNANERLDGSGYPKGKRGDQLSELIRLLSVIKAVNKLTHGRNGIPPRTPLDAYRMIYEADRAYDKTILVEYIQAYGLYPIGSLAKFSGGFLAWIMDIDGKGMPTQVQVVKNLRFPDTNMHTVMGKEDMPQIGKLEGVVHPREYGIELKS